jgi:hypothetical protein
MKYLTFSLLLGSSSLLAAGAEIRTAAIDDLRAASFHFEMPTNAMGYLEWQESADAAISLGPNLKFSFEQFRSFYSQAVATNNFSANYPPGARPRGVPVVEGAVVNSQGELLFWELVGRKMMRFRGKSYSSVDITIPEIETTELLKGWPDQGGEFKLPEYSEIESIDVHPRDTEWFRRKTTNRATLLRLFKLILDHKSRPQTQFIVSDWERVSTRQAIKTRAHAGEPPYNDTIGVLVTKQKELFFWELFLQKYLFLQHADGRMCWLSPKVR